MPGEERLQDQDQDQDRLWPMSRQPGDILALAVAVAQMSDVAVESESGEKIKITMIDWHKEGVLLCQLWFGEK